MPVHLLSDANIGALSIVGKGANRKRWFLKKEASDEDLLTFPAPHRLVKAADWSAVYCVVAEPGALEDPGTGADDPSILDRWASADEIRKAAHRFMANGALVNKLHESLDPYGALVENAVALADFQVGGDTIKKGSWYVAIEPNAEGKEAIEKGEFSGVSVQGTALRTLVEKALKPGERVKIAGPLRHLIAHYRKKPHFFRSCRKDNLKRFGPRTNAICARLKDIALQTTTWRKGAGSLAKADGAAAWETCVGECGAAWYDAGLTDDDAKMALKAIRDDERSKVKKGILYRIGKAVGVSDDELADLDDLDLDDVEKARPTFAERMARRDFEDELPQAFDELRSVVYSAFYPLPDDDDADRSPRELIEESLDEFKAWAVGLLDASKIEKVKADLEKAGVQIDLFGNVDREMGLTPDETTKLDDLSKAVTELPAEIAKAIKGESEKGDEKEPTLSDVAKAVADLTEKVAKADGEDGEDGDAKVSPEDLAKALTDLKADADRNFETIAKGITALAQGDSTQPADEPVAKSGGNGSAPAGVL